MAAYTLNKGEKKEFYKELMTLAIPIGLQSLLTALIGATDALMLGRLSQDAVAAVSLANQIAFVMNLFIGGIVGGGGALMAQYWGKEDKTMVKNLLCMILKWSVAVCLIFFGLAMAAPEALMRIYTPERSLIDIGASYLRAVAPSYLFVGITQCYYLKMKIEGEASKSVIISVAVLIADVTLDFFLIYVLRIGANGSAYSTVAVELVALIWCVADSYGKDRIRADLPGLRWRSALITKDFLKLMLPMLASMLLWGLSITTQSLIMGHMGSDATAAASIAAVLLELVTCVCKGVSAGTGIIMGKLLGKSLFEKAEAYAVKFCHISIWVGIIHMALLCLIAPIVTAFFILTETARHYLMVMLIFTAFYVFGYSVNTIVTCGVLPAGGDAGYDAISVFFATWCFALPLALLGTFLFKWPVLVVYILMRLDELVKLPFIYPRYKKYLWLNNLTREDT